jgi:tRNA-splicing ligase RtcB
VSHVCCLAQLVGPDGPEEYREVGQPVVIGGSMGTGSYILVGTAETERRAWSSASHGPVGR